MNFTEVFKSIIENFGGEGVFIVSLLIICIVIISVGLPVIINKTLTKNNENITNTLSSGLIDIGNSLTQSLKEQNSAQQEVLMKIVDKLPSTKEEKEYHDKGQQYRFDIIEKVNNLLIIMLNKYHASRVAVLEFHNGGQNISGLPFVKYNMEYEQIGVDVKNMNSVIKDLPASIIGPIYADLTDGSKKFKVYYQEDIEDFKNRSTVLHSYLKELNVDYIIFAPIYDSNNLMFGVCCIEYSNTVKPSFVMSKEKLDELIDSYKLELHDDIIRLSNYLTLNKEINK